MERAIGNFVMEVYGPLADKIGGWCLGLIVAWHIGKFIMIWLRALYGR